jgi:hypothetical protein
MIMVTEQAALKAQSQFEQIQGFISQAVQDGLRIDTVERNLMRFLLSLGYSLLSSYVAQQGTVTSDRRSRPLRAARLADCPSGTTAATCRSSAS